MIIQNAQVDINAYTSKRVCHPSKTSVLTVEVDVFEGRLALFDTTQLKDDCLFHCTDETICFAVELALLAGQEFNPASWII